MVTRRPPPPTEEERLAARKARHKRWIAILSESDWDRVRALARQVTANYVPARLDDLDASGIAVGVGWPHTGTSGERIGTIKTAFGDVVVLVWEKG